MIIRVLLFARFRETAGTDRLELEIPPGTTTAAIWEEVGRKVPALRDVPAPLVAVDEIYARADRAIDRPCDVAFFPPVSGG